MRRIRRRLRILLMGVLIFLLGICPLMAWAAETASEGAALYEDITQTAQGQEESAEGEELSEGELSYVAADASEDEVFYEEAFLYEDEVPEEDEISDEDKISEDREVLATEYEPELHDDESEPDAQESDAQDVSMSFSGTDSYEEEEPLLTGRNADSLLGGYLGIRQTLQEGPALFSSYYFESRLEGATRELYDGLISFVGEIAEGSRTVTRYTYVVPESLLSGYSWSAAELGVDSLTEYDSVTGQSKLTKEAFTAALGQLCDRSRAVRSVIRDCPYEMFWFGNSVGYTYPGYQYTIRDAEGELRLTLNRVTIIIRLKVSADYALSDSETDPVKMQAINQALQNAEQIVSDASGMWDISKLTYYKDAIRALSEYHYEAAGGGVPYGDPWQIVYLFDGDPETKVVCEGFSKGFQYLCEKSSFRGMVSVYSIAGNLGSDGGHMWNIICINGVNYMADITNAGEGYGDETLFLAHPILGDVESGYTFLKGTARLSYTYREEARQLYSDSELTLPLCHEDVPKEPVTIDTGLNLLSEIGMNFYFTLAEGEDPEAYTVEVSFQNTHQTVQERFALSDLPFRNGEYRYENRLRLGSDEMYDAATVTVVNGEGDIEEDPVAQGTYSVTSIASEWLGDENYERYWPLLAAMLQYGHYAGIEFRQNENLPPVMPVFPGLSAIPEEYAPAGDPDVLKDYIESFDSSLALDASVGMYLYIKPKAGYGIRDFGISVTLHGRTVPVSEPRLVHGEIVVQVNGIYPDHMVDDYDITIRAGGKSATYTRSVMNCAYSIWRQGRFVDLTEALYQYSRAAKQVWSD